MFHNVLSALFVYLVIGIIWAEVCRCADQKRGLPPSCASYMNMLIRWPVVLYIAFFTDSDD